MEDRHQAASPWIPVPVEETVEGKEVGIKPAGPLQAPFAGSAYQVEHYGGQEGGWVMPEVGDPPHPQTSGPGK